MTVEKCEEADWLSICSRKQDGMHLLKKLVLRLPDLTNGQLIRYVIPLNANYWIDFLFY